MTKAEREEKFAGRVHKEAIRLFVFSKDCPAYLNPYNYVRNALMDKFVVAANDILSKNEKNNFVSGFTASVVQQIETKGYVSNNQLAQIQRILSENGSRSPACPDRLRPALRKAPGHIPSWHRCRGPWYHRPCR